MRALSSRHVFRQGMSSDRTCRVPTRRTAGLRFVAAAQKVHAVAPGDSLWTISLKYKVTIDDLYAANAATIGRDRSLILPGQKLVVPGAKAAWSPAPAPAPAKTESVAVSSGDTPTMPGKVGSVALGSSFVLVLLVISYFLGSGGDDRGD